MIRLSSSSLLLLKSSSSVSIPSSSISSISKSLSPSISILSLYVPCIYQQYRYAGGGGRPGGKPTFNWKQRKLLGLDELKDQKDMRVKFAGDFNDLKPFMDITRYNHYYYCYSSYIYIYVALLFFKEVILLKKLKKWKMV